MKQDSKKKNTTNDAYYLKINFDMTQCVIYIYYQIYNEISSRVSVYKKILQI